ncbi:MAG: DUF2911 domain-containing protein [Bacteroidetes bacterium]|nr:DUF2911 domain-containing protein [Bacteroidota bacterium]
MNKLITLSILALSAWTAEAQPLRTPTASTSQSIKQDFGLTSIDLSYSRPNMKGRKIYGDLVPYGSVWRTGANGATTINFADEVWVGDKKVPAGKYGLLTIPNAGEWTVILTKQLDVTSPSAYKPEMDVVRVKANPQSLPFSIETFTMMFSNVTSNSIDLMMIWEETAVTLPIRQDVEARVMAQIENAMNKDNRPYAAAAQYYVENGKDLNKAAQWFDKATEINPNQYWVWYQKAGCLAKLGRKADAMAASKKSLELATAAKNPDYVALNEKLLATMK